MSDAGPKKYKLEHGAGVLDQLKELKAEFKKAGRFDEYITILEQAVERLQTDPHGWGDPLYRSKTVDAVAYRAIHRPLLFRYVIYETVHAVVVLGVEMFAIFD